MIITCILHMQPPKRQLLKFSVQKVTLPIFTYPKHPNKYKGKLLIFIDTDVKCV